MSLHQSEKVQSHQKQENKKTKMPERRNFSPLNSQTVWAHTKARKLFLAKVAATRKVQRRRYVHFPRSDLIKRRGDEKEQRI